MGESTAAATVKACPLPHKEGQNSWIDGLHFKLICARQLPAGLAHVLVAGQLYERTKHIVDTEFLYVPAKITDCRGARLCLFG